MKARYFFTPRLGASILALIALPLATLSAAQSGGAEASYHGQMGYQTGSGMLEKWCALPNFSFEEQGGIEGWTGQSCNGCHIGAAWNETKPVANCNSCHESATLESAEAPTVANCAQVCHKKDTAKRGDVFTAERDVHIAAGFVCQDCHERYDDGVSDHQFLKGTAMDTTEPTMEGTLSCTSQCHLEQPHAMTGNKGITLDGHTAKVACETCHTGLRWGKAMVSRQWNVFTTAGKPVTTWKEDGWLPEYKWYDNTGPGASGDYDLPILSHTERRNAPGAKIYPFNAVTVDWFVKRKNSAFDDVIITPEVKAADADGDRTVTLDEMQVFYRKARLLTADMNFSISHSVVPADEAFGCNDCHGKKGWVLNWNQLGYAKDPRKKGKK